MTRLDIKASYPRDFSDTELITESNKLSNSSVTKVPIAMSNGFMQSGDTWERYIA